MWLSINITICDNCESAHQTHMPGAMTELFDDFVIFVGHWNSYPWLSDFSHTQVVVLWQQRLNLSLPIPVCCFRSHLGPASLFPLHVLGHRGAQVDSLLAFAASTNDLLAMTWTKNHNQPLNWPTQIPCAQPPLLDARVNMFQISVMGTFLEFLFSSEQNIKNKI